MRIRTPRWERSPLGSSGGISSLNTPWVTWRWRSVGPDYFQVSFLSGFGAPTLPAWLSTGYRTALLPELGSGAPRTAGRLRRASSVCRSSSNVPAFAIVARNHLAAPDRGPRERPREQRDGGGSSCWCLPFSSSSDSSTFTRRTITHSHRNGFAGIHHGAAIVFFAYIGFDAISTAAEETRNPQRNLPLGISGRTGDVHR